eukprot:1175564-Pyramimonas_sp.AAC.1
MAPGPDTARIFLAFAQLHCARVCDTETETGSPVGRPRCTASPRPPSFRSRGGRGWWGPRWGPEE